MQNSHGFSIKGLLKYLIIFLVVSTSVYPFPGSPELKGKQEESNILFKPNNLTADLSDNSFTSSRFSEEKYKITKPKKMYLGVMADFPGGIGTLGIAGRYLLSDKHFIRASAGLSTNKVYSIFYGYTFSSFDFHMVRDELDHCDVYFFGALNILDEQTIYDNADDENVKWEMQSGNIVAFPTFGIGFYGEPFRIYGKAKITNSYLNFFVGYPWYFGLGIGYRF